MAERGIKKPSPKGKCFMDTKEIRQKLFDAIKEKSGDYGLTADEIKALAEAYHILLNTEIMCKAMENEFELEQKCKIVPLSSKE